MGTKSPKVTDGINGDAGNGDGQSFLQLVQANFQRVYGLLIVCITFTISVGMLNCTKYVYVTYHFRYPLWLTATHMAMSYLVAAAGIHIFKLVPDRRVLSFREQVSVVAPFSVLGASSIACGNAALLFLYPSFHEMLQNTTPLWTVICNIVFKGVRYNGHAYLALVPVTLGGMLCAMGEPSKFAGLGMLFSFGAAMTRAIRAIVQGNLLRGQKPIDSLTLLYYATPFNLSMFLVGSAIVEGKAPWQNISSVPVKGQLFIAMVALLAALYNLFAFLMISHMGAVLTMVVSNLKTPTIIVLSMLVFGNKCTALQVCGFAVAFGGTYAFNKYGKEVADEQAKPAEMSHVASSVVGKQMETIEECCTDDEELGLVATPR